MPFNIPAGGQRGYQIARSVRFNQYDNPYISRIPGVTGEPRVWTVSMWVRRASLTNQTGGQQFLFDAYADASNYTSIYFHNTSTPDSLNLLHYQGGVVQLQYRTQAVFRDPAAWYHIVVNFNSLGAGTPVASIYVNGVLITAWVVVTNTMAQNSQTYINQAARTHSIGRWGGSTTSNFSGLFADFHLIDGQSLPPTSFGFFDPATNVWTPKKYTGTFGTNGVWLTFADNSTGGALGKDDAGGAPGAGAGANDWAINNIEVVAGTHNDSLVNTPTNFGVDTGLGGEVRGNYCTLAANDKVADTTGVFSQAGLALSSISSTYWGAARGTMWVNSGKWYYEGSLLIGADGQVMFGLWRPEETIAGIAGAVHTYPGQTTFSWGYHPNGTKVNAGAGVAYGATYTSGDRIGVALDLDNGTLSFYKNGVSQGVAFTGMWGGAAYYAAAVGSFPATTSAALGVCFGERPFIYPAPAGYKCWCTQNLTNPALPRGDDGFVADWRSGTGANFTMAGKRFQPGLIWNKNRAGANYNMLTDIVRGNTKTVSSNAADVEQTITDAVLSFNADGWTGGVRDNINTNTHHYADRLWRRSAGFMDVVTYTGNGGVQNVAHGLGATPCMIIVKSRTNSRDWAVYYWVWGAGAYYVFNTNAALGSDTSIWNNTAPTSAVFTVGPHVSTNENGHAYVAYLFNEVPGFSRIWYYTGNALADGPLIPCGFRPRFIMLKNASGTGHWWTVDAARLPFNGSVALNYASLPDAEYTTAGVEVDLVSNGIKIRNTAVTTNSAGHNVGIAFAENPFKYALAR